VLAADPAETVFVVEGEKDVDRLAELGLVATTNPMGAGKWQDHYSDFLRGRRVAIIPDADKPGRDHAQQVAQSLLGKAASVGIVELPDVPEKGDVSDFLDGAGSIHQLRDLATRAPEWTPTAASGNPAGPGPAPSSSPCESQAQILLRLAGAATLFHDPTDRTYAVVPIGGHLEVHEIRSTGFRRWLKRQFYLEEDRPPSAQALQDALGILDARAMHDGPEEEIFVRVARRGDRIYIDLGDATWRAVRIDAAGWRVVKAPRVRFRRPPGMRPLPRPARGGTIDRLKDFVNVEDAELLFLIAWLAAALRPSGPYPILVLIAEAGSAKSSLARLARRLTDPHACQLRSEPKEPRDLMVSAVNGWVIALDNLSTIWPWLSDALCRLATGGGFATRTLYSNDEETFLDAMRPVILTGINDFVTPHEDLMDRALFLHLPPIPEERRRTEEEFWPEVDAALPQLLGALLDAVSGGLRLLSEVKSNLPRMGDFAKFGEAVSRALGYGVNTFLEAYRKNRRTASESVVEDSPVAGAVRKLATTKGQWSGTAGELLIELTAIVGDQVAGSRRWPRSARGMSGALRRLAPALRMVGVYVKFGERTEGTRPITISLAEGGGNRSSSSSGSSSAPDSRVQPHDGRNGQRSATVSQPSYASGPKTGCGDGHDGHDGPIPTHSADPGREVVEL
jgi:hypothetical protein